MDVSLVESMAKMLLNKEKSEDTKPKIAPDGIALEQQQKCKNGIIIDWLQKIDPELKQVCTFISI